MIKYVKGDLFTTKADVIVHGCNCFHKMGAGVAAIVKREYPGAYQADKDFGRRGDITKLGEYSWWHGAHNLYISQWLTIVNLYTQYLHDAELKPFDYTAFVKGLKSVLQDYPDATIAMPKIGAGLAGGDWSVISAIIEAISGDREIWVYEL